MIIRLSELDHRKGEPLSVQVTLEPADIQSRHQEIRGMSPVETTGEAVKLGNMYYVNGSMEADVSFVCARCLKPFTEHMHVPFSESFTTDETVADDEDSDVQLLAEEEIELDPLLSEDFLLAIPAFPLCEEDCKGLCPTCGANRNEESCSCKNERIDPRLAGLADFFNKSNE